MQGFGVIPQKTEGSVDGYEVYKPRGREWVAWKYRKLKSIWWSILDLFGIDLGA